MTHAFDVAEVVIGQRNAGSPIKLLPPQNKLMFSVQGPLSGTTIHPEANSLEVEEDSGVMAQMPRKKAESPYPGIHETLDEEGGWSRSELDSIGR